MAEERKSWISQVVAEELISEAVDCAVLGAEGSEDGTTVVGMLATKVEEVRPPNYQKDRAEWIFAQVTMSETSKEPESEAAPAEEGGGSAADKAEAAAPSPQNPSAAEHRTRPCRQRG